MNSFRTPDERFRDLPGYDFAPHYTDQDGLRMHRVDEGHTAVEVLVSKQRSLEGQEPLTPDSEVGVSQVLKGLQEQAATCQQHNGERRLDNDERVPEPMAACARCAASAVAEPFLRRESRPS